MDQMRLGLGAGVVEDEGQLYGLFKVELGIVFGIFEQSCLELVVPREISIEPKKRDLLMDFKVNSWLPSRHQFRGIETRP